MRERIRKRIFVLSLVLLFLCLFPVKAWAKEGHVYDGAGILSGREERELDSLAASLEKHSRMNAVVMTTEDAGGLDEREYADWFYEKQGFAENGKKGGAIFYIDMDNRAVGMETEGDMILFMTDRRIEKAIDAAYGHVENGSYAEALKALIDTTAQYIEEGIESGQVTYNEDTGRYKKYRSITPFEAAAALLVAVAAGGASCAFVAARYRMKWGSQAYDFRSNGKLDETLSQELFLGQHITRRHIPKDNGGAGGGGGPMSTTHTSAGGHEFGGGSRKF